ncbi:MAG: DNA polymerase III subunit delta' [Aquabacterium sp.]
MSRRAPQIGVTPEGGLGMPWLEGLLAPALALKGHALLLHGPAGSDQLQAALLLAQAWLCEVPQGARKPCGRCASCQQVRQRSHPDLHILVAEADQVAWGWLPDDHPLLRSTAKPSRQLRVDQVRAASAWAASTSARGQGKALVLHPAESLNETSANALLKTLEEPQPGMRMLLSCSDPARMLPTLLSRCQRLPVPLPAPDEAARWLTGQGVSEAPALLVAAGGSPQAALELAEAGVTPATLQALPRAVAAGLAAPLSGQALPRAVDLLLRLCHDALAVAAGGAPRFFALADLVPGADLPLLLDWQRTLMQTARHADHPVNTAWRVESLVAAGARAWHGAHKAAAGSSATGRRPGAMPLNSGR